MQIRRPVLLVILDGVGVNPSPTHNAIHAANTPNLDRFFSQSAHTVLKASGRAVGLPEGQMGNSEVGHMTIGCGCVIRQDLVLINDAIEDGSFFEKPELLAAMQRCQQHHRPAHLLGLVSDGGVHSHISHLLALIELCRRHGVIPKVHMITDGRDTAPQIAMQYLPVLEQALSKCGGAIATVCGRYYAMDRDHRWDRTYKYWSCLVHAEGRLAATAGEAISSAYEQNETDEFIRPVWVSQRQPLTKADEILFFNFRNDRPRQITAALSQEKFRGFDRGEYGLINVICLTQYDRDYQLPVVFVSERPQITLGEVVSQAGLKQFRCAETEKYAHVTFFLNGGREQAFEGEKRVMVPSPQVATYDLAPEMSAAGVADATIAAIQSGEYPLVVVNFANGDMVGHTAVREAVITAVETLDREVGRLMDCALASEYSVLVTSDHGNCDEMLDPITGAPHTQHTVFPVPCFIFDKEPWRLSINAGLSSVTPTVLQLMGIPIPEKMTGESLLLPAVSEYQAAWRVPM